MVATGFVVGFITIIQFARSGQMGMGMIGAISRTLRGTSVRGTFTGPLVDSVRIPVTDFVPPPGSTAVIMRTFSGHGEDLRKCIASFVAQTNPNWAVFVVNTDSGEFPRLREMLRSFSDPRVMQLNDVAKGHFDYWDSGYGVNDEAIWLVAKHFGRAFRWVLSTNGDNYYFPSFLDATAQPYFQKAVDCIAYDFFSRWDPFALGQSSVGDKCMQNMLRTGETDLGANVWNLHRWIEDGVNFTQVAGARPADMHLSPEMEKVVAPAVAVYDGKLAEYLTRVKMWRVAMVERCLFSHSPNPWECSAVRGQLFLNSPLRSEVSVLQRWQRLRGRGTLPPAL
jgi:hypothetical protein